MRVFLDTNIIIDLFVKREPFTTNSKKVVQSLSPQDIYISALSVHICMYILKVRPGGRKWKALRYFFGSINILPLTEETIIASYNIPFKDFEDSLQYTTANFTCSSFITRNIKDYEKLHRLLPTSMKIVSPREFMSFK